MSFKMLNLVFLITHKNTMKKILLADDHSIVRTGLKMFIEKLIPDSVIDEAVDGKTAYEQISANDYELIVLDANMPETDPFKLVTSITTLKADANILMFTMNAEEVYAKKFLQVGAKGYLNKGSSENEIKSAVEHVLNGKTYLSQTLSRQLTDEALNGKANNPFDELSAREFEIVQHLIKGESVAEIGAKLKLHSSTVGTYKARIFKKLHCSNIIDINLLAKIHKVIQ
jgi:two-component system invasion response regulator UvrY